MEKVITNFTELGDPEGQLVLINSPFGGEQLATFSSKIDDGNGKFSYGFLAEIGDYTFREGRDKPSDWNIRLIDEKHPRYNPAMVQNGKQFSQMMDMVKSMFGE